MRLEKAREIGYECGLGTDAEAVNNIVIHAGNLFVYADIDRELAELNADAKAAGLRFSAICGDALQPDDPQHKPCRACQKLAALPWEEQ